MKKADADKIFAQLIDEMLDKTNEIIKQAQADGTWKSGLDTNRDLFRDLNAEYFQKAQDLAAQIDDEE